MCSRKSVLLDRLRSLHHFAATSDDPQRYQAFLLLHHFAATSDDLKRYQLFSLGISNFNTQLSFFP